MAANCSFVLEDTDEDFFDKLVNDDDNVNDYMPSTLSLKQESNVLDDKDSVVDNKDSVFDDKDSVFDDKDSVDAKGLSNLSISDLGKDESVVGMEPNDVVTLSSVSEDPDNGRIRLEDAKSENRNHGIGGTAGVKEVQWSDFGSGSVENGLDAFGSDPDFFNEVGGDSFDQIGKEDGFVVNESNGVVDESFQVNNVNDYSQQVESNEVCAVAGEQEMGSTDVNSSQYWENLYPGWRYDANTGQWYQVDESYNEASYAQGANNTDFATDWTALNNKSEVSYLQQSAQSVVGSVAETGKTESITNWNQGSQDIINKEYPPHMVFDPQYPGWYYDMNTQEWRSLDDYNSQSTAVVAQDLVNQNGFGSNNTYYKDDQKTYSGQEQDYNWNGSLSNAQQGSTTWQPNVVDNNNQQVANHFGGSVHVDNDVNQQQSYDYGGTTAHVNNGFPAFSGSQSFVPRSQLFSQPLEQSETLNAQQAYGNESQLSYLQQQPVQSGHQVSYASSAGRSSAGRPPHALVTFGFGGKLIVMKDSTDLTNASYGGQGTNSGSISVLSLAEVVTEGAGVHDYFHTLCQHPFPGPLSGGNVGGKELNRWIDDMIARFETSDVDHNKGEVLRLLLSLLKIASQHYGKLRSPFGSDSGLKENDAPEVAVARLFASVKNSAEYNNYGAFSHCLQQVPSEGQTRETAAEVQTLLVSGRKKEALLRAQEGRLWGPALVLAAQLGDQFYVDTAKKMALAQLVPGSPLRTLCLLIAGQPADVFAADATTDGGIPDAVNMSQQPKQAQLSGNSMLDDWKDNLAVITANRTKDDELVLIHLGDCLWKERSDIIAAHICYLVAEANFEPYSDSSRLCLIGADHWKYPRTYASPEAIQRTEVYEYSKLLGNSQFTLLPFQPYKLIYAHMLAEVGRLTDSLKYCHAITKSLKTGRIPEVETWRQLVTSLEDRIKIHQQGGFTANLAPGKIVGKLLNLFDSTAQRVVGGTPPPAPSTSGGSAQKDHHQQPQKGFRFLTSQSTMAMSSLLTSPSMEQINQGDGTRRLLHTRSASEPDFGRSSKQDQDDTLRENSADSQRKASGNTSRFGRFAFGSGILQKTVSMVLKPRQDKQAKLGDTNKFYYDEKLKRWVEEGVDSPAEEAAIPPPPTMATFQNGSPDYSLKTGLRTESMSNGSSEFASPTPPSHTSGVPPIPASTNQFSARGRTGVRARYVDTFNKGGGNPTNLFQSPSVPTIKPKTSTNPNPNFFVPTAAPAPEQPAADIAPDNLEQHTSGNQPPVFTSRTNQPAMGMQKFASMNDMSKEGSLSTSTSTSTSTSSFTYDPMSRRTLSWSGGLNQNLSVSGNNSGQKAVGGMPRHTYTPNETGSTHSSNDDLLDVEL